MKCLSILGSTGSIGTNALEVVRRFPDKFSVVALGAGRNTALLARQIREFKPDLAVVLDENLATGLKQDLGPTRTRIAWGPEGYAQAASLGDADMLVSAMVGGAGLLPTLAALDAGKPVALANKETLVMAGELVMARAQEKGVPILPIDSEHSAVFQCIQGRDPGEISRILLTASGGPFRERPIDDFASITREDALNHPTWAMGRKITIDSATLMNKGLEVIEARWLFGVGPEKIDVVVHPQSVIHSMVELIDCSVMAQLGAPDMLGAIAYAMSYPERLPLGSKKMDFQHLAPLSFAAPDLKKFPCLSLAFEALKAGRTYPTVLNAANEEAVQAFLDSRVAFIAIPELVEKALAAHEPVPEPGLSDILDADAWARKLTRNNIKHG